MSHIERASSFRPWPDASGQWISERGCLAARSATVQFALVVSWCWPSEDQIPTRQDVNRAKVPTHGRAPLRELAGTYVGWSADGHAGVKMAEVRDHLDETWFLWYGGTDDDAPFYYRVHSPVILIEFDHHPGIGFDNDIPTRHHVHTVVRTPNGGDYGADLLRQHHAAFDHTHGGHHPR